MTQIFVPLEPSQIQVTPLVSTRFIGKLAAGWTPPYGFGHRESSGILTLWCIDQNQVLQILEVVGGTIFSVSLTGEGYLLGGFGLKNYGFNLAELKSLFWLVQQHKEEVSCRWSLDSSLKICQPQKTVWQYNPLVRWSKLKSFKVWKW